MKNNLYKNFAEATNVCCISESYPKLHLAPMVLPGIVRG